MTFYNSISDNSHISTYKNDLAQKYCKPVLIRQFDLLWLGKGQRGSITPPLSCASALNECSDRGQRRALPTVAPWDTLDVSLLTPSTVRSWTACCDPAPRCHSRSSRDPCGWLQGAELLRESPSVSQPHGASSAGRTRGQGRSRPASTCQAAPRCHHPAQDPGSPSHSGGTTRSYTRFLSPRKLQLVFVRLFITTNQKNRFRKLLHQGLAGWILFVQENHE